MNLADMSLEELQGLRGEIDAEVSRREAARLTQPASPPKAIRKWQVSFNEGLSQLTGEEVFDDGWSIASEDYDGCADSSSVSIVRDVQGQYWVHMSMNGGYCQARLLGVPHVDDCVPFDNEEYPACPEDKNLVNDLCQDHFGVGIDLSSHIYR